MKIIKHIPLEGGAAEKFHFSNIPSYYKHLKIFLSSRSNRAWDSDAVKIIFQDDLGPHYTSVIQWMQGGIANKTLYPNPSYPSIIGYAPGSTSPPDYRCNIEITVFDYANLNSFPTWQARGVQPQNISNYWIYDAGGTYLKKGVINSMSLIPNIGTGFSRYSLATLCGLHEEDVIPAEKFGSLKIFIAMGQSNMVGSGLMKPNVPDENSWVYGVDYTWHITQESVCELGGNNPVDSVNFNGYEIEYHYGMINSFSKRLHQYTPAPFGFIPVAKSGSSIDEWARSLDPSTLYGAAYKRTQSSLSAGVVSGILWFQGEADAKIEVLANSWKVKFEQLIIDWRNDYGNTPIVFMQLGNNPSISEYPFWSVVKSQQASVSAANVVMIQTDDLAMQNGNAHFLSNSYDEIGFRAANQIYNII